MDSIAKDDIKALLRSELEITRRSFNALLDSLSEADIHKKSLNPGWTNGEILAHMTFGFIILNVLMPMARLWGRLPRSSSKPFADLLNILTGPFNWFNALGARMQGRVYNYGRIGELFDRVYFSLLKQIATIKNDEWGNGMYYPTKWDAGFDEFMTLEKLFLYPLKHYKFHLSQINRE